MKKYSAFAPEYNRQEIRLLQLLSRACEELRAKKDTISLFSHYNSYKEFADHIQEKITYLQEQRTKMDTEFNAALEELYEIFLPTSDWDDAGGSLNLANEITAILNTIIF